MAINYRVRITQTSGQISYDVTSDDTLLFFDTASDITDPIEVVFPVEPIEGQLFGLTTRRTISDVTLTSQYFPITAPITSLSPSNPIVWFYSSEGNRWFVHP